MTNYHVFLCIVVLAAAIYAIVSVRNALRTGTEGIGDGTLGRAVHRSEQPALFWLLIAARIVVVAVAVIAVALSVLRRD